MLERIGSGISYLYSMKNLKRPTDLNQRAKSIVDIATSDTKDPENEAMKLKNPHAVALGKLGGLKGGKARAAKLTSEQRSDIAKKAAKTRWNKK